MICSTSTNVASQLCTRPSRGRSSIVVAASTTTVYQPLTTSASATTSQQLFDKISAKLPDAQQFKSSVASSYQDVLTQKVQAARELDIDSLKLNVDVETLQETLQKANAIAGDVQVQLGNAATEATKPFDVFDGAWGLNILLIAVMLVMSYALIVAAPRQ